MIKNALVYKKWINKYVIILILMFLSLTGYAQVKNNIHVAPKEFSSLNAIQKWVNSKEVRGFGLPESFEYSSGWINVFVTWNDPYSGRSSVYSNVFVKLDKNNWVNYDSSLFEAPDSLSFIYLDSSNRNLVFIGVSGSILKTISLEKNKNILNKK